MQRLFVTLDSPAANIALDEALLEQAEAAGPDCEYLRVWESPEPIVVVGRSSRVWQEVDLQACGERGVPILRRSSGGAAIVAGSGCLMYAVVLSYQNWPELRGIPQAHAYVLDRLVATLRSHVPSAHRAGTSDLAMTVVSNGNALKFSGNSLRVKRTHVLYHGTLLYDFDLSLISVCLKTPPRQPAYRQARAHSSFVANLPMSRGDVEESVLTAWPTSGELAEWPRARTERLVRERYSQDDWNLAYGRHAAGTE